MASASQKDVLLVMGVNARVHNHLKFKGKEINEKLSGLPAEKDIGFARQLFRFIWPIETKESYLHKEFSGAFSEDFKSNFSNATFNLVVGNEVNAYLKEPQKVTKKDSSLDDERQAINDLREARRKGTSSTALFAKATNSSPKAPSVAPDVEDVMRDSVTNIDQLDAVQNYHNHDKNDIPPPQTRMSM